MNLSEFIETDQQGLIDEWSNYALSICPDDSHLTDTQLRDSAVEILSAISQDMSVAVCFATARKIAGR